jgi:hypothetical protein
MSKKHLKIEVLDEKVVAQTAAILGPFSAAQRALDDAKARRERGQHVILGRHGSVIVVVPTEMVINR